MKTLKFRLTSESPLILHNGQTADPMNSFSKQLKQISGKRGKTDADLERLMEIEWYASLYLDNGRVCIPGEVLEAALVNGSKKQKAGQKAKAGLFVPDNVLLEFDGDGLSIDDLWKRDENRLTKAVRVGTAKVMRTRFIIKNWAATAEIVYDPQLFNPSEIVDIMRVTGEIVGICDWRPKFGRYASELLTIEKQQSPDKIAA